MAILVEDQPTFIIPVFQQTGYLIEYKPFQSFYQWSPFIDLTDLHDEIAGAAGTGEKIARGVFDFNITEPIVILDHSPFYVAELWLSIGSPLEGTITIGDDGDNSKWMNASQNVPSMVANYAVQPWFYLTGTSIKLFASVNPLVFGFGAYYVRYQDE